MEDGPISLQVVYAGEAFDLTSVDNQAVHAIEMDAKRKLNSYSSGQLGLSSDQGEKRPVGVSQREKRPNFSHFLVNLSFLI